MRHSKIHRTIVPIILSGALTLLGADCGAPLDFFIFDYTVPACHLGELALPKEPVTEKETKIIPTDTSGRITCNGVQQFDIRSKKIDATFIYTKVMQSENECHLLLIIEGGIAFGDNNKHFLNDHPQFPKDADSIVAKFEAKIPALKRRTGPKISLMTVRRHGPMSADLERLCNAPSNP